ncbi:helix-turn-helix domain-containing protein [Acidocella sp.]|uniref:helix-turn-helix domain-containing protein n=1 Tax=Acidocella sp. TaxID=50710 RepID=UPI003D045DF2
MSPKSIRAFSRGLAVLAALNRLGNASVLTLARETGMPRSSIYRLLQTLLDDGYVGRRTADEHFHLRLKVRGLSEGFEDEHWIAAVARPELVALTQRISWPCDVSTLEGLKMIIHDTTHRLAPLSIDRNMIGQELPLLGSASGLAYLAFAPREERETLLAMLARSKNPQDALAKNEAQTRKLISATCKRGYALRQGGEIWPHTGAVALPVFAGGKLLGCINAIWMARAISAQEGVARCLAPLRKTKRIIEQRLARENGESV